MPGVLALPRARCWSGGWLRSGQSRAQCPSFWHLQAGIGSWYGAAQRAWVLGDSLPQSCVACMHMAVGLPHSELGRSLVCCTMRVCAATPLPSAAAPRPAEAPGAAGPQRPDTERQSIVRPKACSLQPKAAARQPRLLIRLQTLVAWG